MVKAAGMLLAFFLAWLLLTGLTAPPPSPAAGPSPGPAVRIIPPPAEQAVLEMAAAPGPPPETHIIYTPNYEYAVQCGRQTLTAYWVEPEE